MEKTTTMELIILFSSLFLEECEQWISNNPKSGYLFIDKALDGRFIVYGE